MHDWRGPQFLSRDELRRCAFHQGKEAVQLRHSLDSLHADHLQCRGTEESLRARIESLERHLRAVRGTEESLRARIVALEGDLRASRSDGLGTGCLPTIRSSPLPNFSFFADPSSAFVGTVVVSHLLRLMH